MHPYLIRLGIHPTVQQFFAPDYSSDENGNLCFSYGRDTEIYGMAFHRIPATDGQWIAGNKNFSMITQVIICSSAMEAMAWLNCNRTAFRCLDNLLFIATGSNLKPGRFRWIKDQLPGRKYGLLFGADLLGHICDVKVAAILRGQLVTISYVEERLVISFRNQTFEMPAACFSLNAFERLTRHRFHVRTLKPSLQLSWLKLLEDQVLKL